MLGSERGAVRKDRPYRDHSTYALTPTGLPIGLMAQKIWARKESVKLVNI